MAVRISKKERQFLYSQNARARRKQQRLHDIYGKRITFETRIPSSFTSRAELNQYKAELKHFNAPYTHRYVMGGVQTERRTGKQEQFNLAIPYSMAQEIRRREKKWNQFVAKNYRNIGYSPYRIKGKEYGMLTVHHVNPWFPETTIPYRTLKQVEKKYHNYYTAQADFESFHTTRDIEKYLMKLQYFMNPEFANKQLSQSKQNYIQALLNTFGDSALPIAELITQLSSQEWAKLYDSEEYIDFNVFYTLNYQDRELQGIAQGVLSYAFDNERLLMREGDRLKAVQDILNLSDVEIKSKMKSNVITYTHNGIRYQVALRYNEIEEFYKTGVTQDILERSEYIGKAVPEYEWEKEYERKRRIRNRR